jgi:pimeloyl-[acyl-carrier protein] methyl ester esterase
LEDLATLDARAAWTARANDLYLLASRDDAIVPAALSAAAGDVLRANRLHWCDNGGHLLPLTNARACAALIREAAES